MLIDKDKEYFLNEDKEIVEVERYVSGDNPFEESVYSWGTTRNEAIERLNNRVDKNAIDAIKERLLNHLESKYKFNPDPEETEIEVYNEETKSVEYVFPAYYEPNDILKEIAEHAPDFKESKYEITPNPDEIEIGVYNKETELVEYIYPIYWDKQDIINDIFQNKFTSTDGFSFDAALDYCQNNNIDISDVFLYREIEADKAIDPDSYAIVFATDENVRDYYMIDKDKKVTDQDKIEFIEIVFDMMKSYLDGKEYNVNLYDMNGKELYSGSGFIGDETEINGMEDYVGEFVESLGEYNSVEECIDFVKQDEKRKSLIGKKIMAYEDIYQFSTGQKVQTRGRGIGVIIGTDSENIHIYDRTNPKGHQEYSIKMSNFNKWIDEGLYRLTSRKLYIDEKEMINSFNAPPLQSLNDKIADAEKKAAFQTSEKREIKSKDDMEK